MRTVALCALFGLLVFVVPRAALAQEDIGSWWVFEGENSWTASVPGEQDGRFLFVQCNTTHGIFLLVKLERPLPDSWFVDVEWQVEGMPRVAERWPRLQGMDGTIRVPDRAVRRILLSIKSAASLSVAITDAGHEQNAVFGLVPEDTGRMLDAFPCKDRIERLPDGGR